jgi:hypothetical protein
MQLAYFKCNKVPQLSNLQLYGILKEIIKFYKFTL